MKYKLIINQDAEEEIIAIVHEPSTLTQEIERIVLGTLCAEHIIGYSDEEIKKLPFSEIECITIFDRKVTAIDINGKRYRIQDSLRNLESVLPSYFIRINKSALANERRILRFAATFNGGVDAVFKCGYKEYVSRRCFTVIKRRYEDI